MGNYSIHIEGVGCHHNTDHPGDADVMARDFVADLVSAGHSVHDASFTCGSAEDLLTPSGEPSRREVATSALYEIASGAAESPRGRAVAALKALGQPTEGLGFPDE